MDNKTGPTYVYEGLDHSKPKFSVDLGWRTKRFITLFPLRKRTNCHEPVAGHYNRLFEKAKYLAIIGSNRLLHDFGV